jgi:hypothetical protein
LVYVNTLMLERVLVELGWEQLPGPVDRRGLTALFWEHIRPCGESKLALGRRLAIGEAAGAATVS